MKNRMLFLFIGFFSLTCKAQELSTDDFELTTPPKPYSEEWLALNASQSFDVAIEAGKLHIKSSETHTKAHVNTSIGTLIPIDDGEFFAGGLYFKPIKQSDIFIVNGKEKSVKDAPMDTRWKKLGDHYSKKYPDSLWFKIEGENTQVVIPFEEGWLYTHGLAHMDINYGTLHKLSLKGKTLTTNKILDLNGMPMAMVASGKTIFITTYQGFYSIQDGKVSIVLDSLFWKGLNPSSIAVKDDKTVFIGMRGGYVMLKLNYVNLEADKLISFYRYKGIKK